MRSSLLGWVVAALIALAAVIGWRCYFVSGCLKSKRKMTNLRQPAVAGSFYPGEKRGLKSQVEGFLKTVGSPQSKGFPQILIVPHAGYPYSGAVAAAAFKALVPFAAQIRRVILLGASHQVWFTGAAIDNHQAWATPLGWVAVELDFARRLVNSQANIFFNSRPHQPEHSLEVELPFLQVVLADFKIIPILLGETNKATQEALAQAIAKNLNPETILIISTDLSHYPPYEIAKKVDQTTIEAITSGDPEYFEQTIQKQMAAGYPGLQTCACGARAVWVGLRVGQILGNGNWRLVKYANSGDTAGDKSRVVGYAAIGYFAEKSEIRNSKFKTNSNEQNEIQFTKEQKQLLLQIARETLKNYLTEGKLPSYQITDPVLNQKFGVFVTLKKHGQLRGCMGVFEPETPLWQTVQKQALVAAFQDPRFPPLTAKELSEITIEISVLSQPVEIDDWRKIKLGKHGVIVRRGNRGGTFLPQVASETGWDLETFLSVLCQQKAGLPPDCYRDPQTQIFIFTAEVFGERY